MLDTAEEMRIGASEQHQTPEIQEERAGGERVLGGNHTGESLYSVCGCSVGRPSDWLLRRKPIPLFKL